MNSAKVLLFLGQSSGGYRISPLDVPSGKPDEVPAERGVILADLRSSGRDDIIISNGSAGTITLLLRK